MIYFLQNSNICNSERNIVVNIFHGSSGSGRGLSAGGGRRGTRCLLLVGGCGLVLLLLSLLITALLVLVAVVVRCATAVVIPPAQHFHFVGDNVVCGTLDTVFALIFSALDAALQINLAAFAQVLAGDFGQTAVHGDVVPFGTLYALAVAVVPSFAGGDAEIADGLAVGHVADFGVATETADKDDFVQ